VIICAEGVLPVSVTAGCFVLQSAILLIERYGLLAVFVNVLLEAAGLPLPCYPVLMIAAALASRSAYGLSEILITGVVATLLADFAWFWSGRQFGRQVLRLLCRISLSPDSCVRQTESTFAKVGPASLGFAKFVPGLANVAVALAGASEISWSSFVLFDGVGATAFIGVAVLLGAVFHNAVSAVLQVLGMLGLWAVLGIAVALGIFLLGKLWQRQRFIRQLRMDRITVDELRALIDTGAEPVILDVRGDETRRREGVIPGSLWAHPSDLDPVIRGYARDTELVVYCSCPNEASAALAAKHLRQAGFRKIRPLLGGTEAWIQAGHEIEPVAVVATDSELPVKQAAIDDTNIVDEEYERAVL
jgi:membrane protein DedA with SNARE-associated domain/rhodanese-related sulfurtransferase